MCFDGLVCVLSAERDGGDGGSGDAVGWVGKRRRRRGWLVGERRRGWLVGKRRKEWLGGKQRGGLVGGGWDGLVG